MSKYGDFLRTQGATEEDIKLLDTPLAQKAFDAQQSAIAAAAADAQKRVDDYKAEADAWYNNTILPNYTAMEQRATAAAANEARARALILASQDEGLKKVAAEMGYKPDTTPAPNLNPAAPAIDPAKFVTVERLQQLSDGVGEGLAELEDMVIEHNQLFPNQRLNVREIRKEALAAKSRVYDFWEKKYNVPAVREARAKADQEAYDKKLRDEGAASARTELASQYGNPDTRPLTSSANFLAPRPGREAKQPWEVGDRSFERVQHATKVVMDQISGQKPS
jgi:hypothetical protein